MQTTSLLADLRYGFRQLRRNPGFASTAVLTLTLGIGANVALFSVVRNVLLKPLPYREPERLVRVWMDNRRLQMREDWASYLNYQDYKRLGTSFESMAAFTEPTLNLTSDGEPERVHGANAEAALFDVLGVKPIQGHLFTKDEEAPGKGDVVVIGWSLWQRRFGGTNVEGKVLNFDDRRFTVIGVMPPGFAFPNKKSEFWAPLVVNERAKRRGGYWLQMVARLRPYVTPAQAQAEMDVAGKQLEQQYPSFNAGYGIYVNPLVNHVAGNVRTPLFVLLGAVGFVLLIACVNVAGLFLTRAEDRSREIMVRSAMGASRATLIRQLVMEAGALAAVAGAAGIAAAYGGVRALLWLAPRDLPRFDEIVLDGWVLLFGIGLTTLTVFLFGLWPAWQLSRIDIQEALRGSGRGMAGAHGAAKTRGVLVVLQCALAILLLAGAGLLLRSFGALRGMDTGFRTANVLTMRVNASNTRYPQGPQLSQFCDQLLQRVRALPGVKGAAATTNLFLSNTPSSGTFTLEDRPPFPPSEQIEATLDTASPGFFETMQARLVRGRFLDAHDWENAPRAAVINETFANRYWPNQDPVGKHFIFGNSKPGPNESWITIVGVIGDMRRRGLHQGARLEVFLPSGQRPARNMQILITSGGQPLALVSAVRAEIRALDALAPVTEISTVEAEIGESLAVRRFQALLLSLFSVLAVVLAAVGIFGLMAQLVVRRTPEIGVRMALGATPHDVLRMVVRQGVLLAAVGAAAGICGAFAMAKVFRSLLFGVSAADPISFAGAIVVMAVAVLLSCGLPAWRAARVDPMVALRNEG
jgi:putative ABC transport system permease protein